MRNPCEACEKRTQSSQGLCSQCILEGFAKAIAEQDPNLVKYEALRDLPIPEPLLEREMDIARQEGWL